MKTFSEIPEKEKTLLLQFPAYISLLAVTHDHEMDKEEKNMAAWLTHIKTFSTDPLLHTFYKAAELVFRENIETLDRQLPKTKTERDIAIRSALNVIENILKNVDPGYAAALHRSMRSYKSHISRAHRNILEYFVFPMPIKGISD
ncbi:MAG: hypothetical protein V4539_12340 [Bacteroidota bacterium]